MPEKEGKVASLTAKTNAKGTNYVIVKLEGEESKPYMSFDPEEFKGIAVGMVISFTYVISGEFQNIQSGSVEIKSIEGSLETGAEMKKKEDQKNTIHLTEESIRAQAWMCACTYIEHVEKMANFDATLKRAEKYIREGV